jgi:RNA polymerase sigma factor (sigma-70 family)
MAKTMRSGTAPVIVPAEVGPLGQDFGMLVKEYRKPLYRFVLRNVGNPADAEDIAQQTFVEAYRAMSTFRGESELSTWLYGIAMNLVRNYLNRAPHRVRKYEADDVLEGVADSTDGPEKLIQRMQLMTRLWGEIGELSADLKRIFLLVAIEGWSYEQAADLLDIPFRAREAIKARLPDLQKSLRD